MLCCVRFNSLKHFYVPRCVFDVKGLYSLLYYYYLQINEVDFNSAVGRAIRKGAGAGGSACRGWWGGSREVRRNPNRAAPPGNSRAELDTGTQELWGWEINFRWL